MLFAYARSTGVLHEYHCGRGTGGALVRKREYQLQPHYHAMTSFGDRLFVRQDNIATIWSFTHSGNLERLAEYRRESRRWPVTRAFRWSADAPEGLMFYDPPSGCAEFCTISGTGAVRLSLSAQLGRDWDSVEPGLWPNDRSPAAGTFGVFAYCRTTGNATFSPIDPNKAEIIDSDIRMNIGNRWTEVRSCQFEAPRLSNLLMWNQSSGEIRIARINAERAFGFQRVVPSFLPRTTESLLRLPGLNISADRTADGVCAYDRKSKALSVYAVWPSAGCIQFQLVTKCQPFVDHDILVAMPRRIGHEP